MTIVTLVASALAISTVAAQTLVSLALTVASAAYQQARMRKLQRELSNRKQVNVAIDGEPFYLPVVYGKAKVSGGKVKHLLKDSYKHATSLDLTFANGLSANQSGSKNEFLFVQQAICYGGISAIKDIIVDDKNWDDDTLKYGQRIHVYTDGNVADPMATLNGIPSTNTFTNTAYASMCFKLNRENYNYNGSPNVSFFVEGREIRDILFDGTNYYLSTGRTYSNNPARVLLDYLTSPVFGKGIPTSYLDLKSFYEAKLICDREVATGLTVAGRVNGKRPDVENEDGTITTQPAVPPVNLKLYECNAVLDSERTIRENIELILESMAEAELIWSGGTYKLLLAAPRNLTEQTALVKATINEDDILFGKMELEFPDSSTRYTQVSARFSNEFEDFVDDTVTWPPSFSTVFNQYLAEDSNQLLKTEVFLPTCTDPYHALAKAEQIVRTSRREMRVKFAVGKKGLLLEPGDIISVTDATSGLNNEILKVESIKLSQDLTAEIEAREYSFENFAWNVPDDVPYVSPKVNPFLGIAKPTNLAFVVDTSNLNKDSIGRLTWTYPNDISVDSFQVEYSVDNIEWKVLSRVKTEYYEVNILPTGVYYFGVKSLDALGRQSSRTSIGPVNFVREPSPPYNLTATETIYYTNNTAGFKLSVTLTWQNLEGPSEIAVLNNFVEYKRSDSEIWLSAGESYNKQITIFDLEPLTSYDFRVTAVSYLGDKSTPFALLNQSFLAIAEAPATPTGISFTITSDGLAVLSWDLATEIDVLNGGAVSIRYSHLTGESATWETAVDLVAELAGNTTSKTVPTIQGTYFIKFKDSLGNYSINPAVIINSFVDSNYNFIGSFAQEPTFSGVKSNFTVSGSTMVTTIGTTFSTYQFPLIDLSEVTTVRLVPELSAFIFSRDDLFCNIPVVCNKANMCGIALEGKVRFFIRTSSDNVTYTAWEQLLAGSYRARYLQVRVEMDCISTNSFFEVTSLSLQVDTKDKIYKGKVTTSASANTTVTFPNNGFYGGIVGTTLPTVGLQVINGQEGDSAVIISRSKTSFVFNVFNSGIRVSREVDWQAIGQ